MKVSECIIILLQLLLNYRVEYDSLKTSCSLTQSYLFTLCYLINIKLHYRETKISLVFRRTDCPKGDIMVTSSLFFHVPTVHERSMSYRNLLLNKRYLKSKVRKTSVSFLNHILRNCYLKFCMKEMEFCLT